MIATATRLADMDQRSEDFDLPTDEDDDAPSKPIQSAGGAQEVRSENTVVQKRGKGRKVIHGRHGIAVVVWQFVSTTEITRNIETRTSEPEDFEDNIGPFLETVYSLDDQGKTRHALDVVFRRMNRILGRGRFGFCDDILRQVDVNKLTSTLLVGFLSVTLSASAFLTARPGFFSKVRAKILAEKGPDQTARLLDKYHGG
jgi:hypothetical protein